MARIFIAAGWLTILAAATSAHAQTPDPAGVSPGAARAFRGEARPRLVVVISIDQFRADYLTRLNDLFLPPETDGQPGGFRYLTERGAWFVDARYGHFPTFTGPGHAVILSGAHPYKTGIVSNDWWDRTERRWVYCVEDRRCTVVGAGEGSTAGPVGSLRMRSSTVGDELKLATAGRAKVVTLAVKDRAAILMGGHAQDASIWYDTAGGRWISSSAFCRDGKLPDWVVAVNNERIPDAMLGQEWSPSVAAGVLAARAIVPRVVGKEIPEGMGAGFPHRIGSGKTKTNYRAFIFTPACNRFVFDTALRAVAGEGLGQDEVPDILALNLSTNDYVGHAWGPYSPEALDLTVQTDRQLAAFLAGLEKDVPGGLKNVLVVLTADHGVSPIPEDASGPGFNMSAGRFSVEAVLRTIAAALTARFGEPAGGSWFALDPVKSGLTAAFLDGLLYLNQDAVREAVAGGRAGSVRDLEQAACDAVSDARIPGVYGCYGRMQVLEGRVADTDLGRRLARGVHPQLASDLIVIPDQMYLQEPMSDGHATSHGTPHIYDTHVPIVLCAPGLIRAGVYADPVEPADIAPTLSLILGVEYPSGCDGRALLPALRP